MYKKFLIVICIISSLNASNTTFENLMDKHSQAYKKLEPHASGISYSVKIETGLLSTIYYDRWRFPSQEAKTAFLQYQKSLNDLSIYLIKKSAKEGLLFGALLAGANYSLYGPEISLKSYGTSWGLPILYSIYHFKPSVKTPYFDVAGKKHDNLFARFDTLTITRGTIFAIISTASALGINLMTHLLK